MVELSVAPTPQPIERETTRSFALLRQPRPSPGVLGLTVPAIPPALNVDPIVVGPAKEGLQFGVQFAGCRDM